MRRQFVLRRGLWVPRVETTLLPVLPRRRVRFEGTTFETRTWREIRAGQAPARLTEDTEPFSVQWFEDAYARTAFIRWNATEITPPRQNMFNAWRRTLTLDARPESVRRWLRGEFTEAHKDWWACLLQTEPQEGSPQVRDLTAWFRTLFTVWYGAGDRAWGTFDKTKVLLGCLAWVWYHHLEQITERRFGIWREYTRARRKIQVD